MTRGRSSKGGRRAGRKAGRAGGTAGLDPMEALRRRIDAIDRRMVDLLNERAGCAVALGGIKKERGLPIYQPSREEEVLGNVQARNRGPLEDAALRRLFERIIDESRRIERLGASTEGAGPAGQAPSGRDAAGGDGEIDD